MALQGSLDTFALGDLIRLLTTTEKTGALAVEGSGRSGRLWFGDGSLIGAGERGDTDPASVLFDLLRLEDDGDFRFDADVGPDAACDPRSASDLLEEAEVRFEEWRPVADLVPSPEVEVALRADVDDTEVTMSAETWRHVVAIGSGTTAGGLATALDLDDVGAAFVIHDLVGAGLVRVDTADGSEPSGVAESADTTEDVETAGTDEAAEVGEPGDADAADEPITDPGDVEASTDPDEEPSDPAAHEPIDPAAELDAWTTAEPLVADEQAPTAVVDPADAVGDDLGDIDDSALGPWEPLGAPAETAPVPAAVASDESLAVDLDATLAGGANGHSYLAGGSDDGTLPEPLPVGPEALPGDPDVEAALPEEATETDGDEHDRRVLRRIISSGNR